MFFGEFVQANHIENELGNILDLVFHDDLNKMLVQVVSLPLSNIVQHHPPVEITFQLKSSPSIQTTENARHNFERADYAGLNDYFSVVDWSVLKRSRLVDDAIAIFYEILYDGVEKYVPKLRKKSCKFPRWYTAETIKAIRKKNKAYQKFKQSGLLSDYSKYSALRGESKHMIEANYLILKH